VQLTSIEANSTLKCFDANGREVNIPKLQFVNGNGQLDISSLKPGLYVIQVNNESVKFIKN